MNRKPHNILRWLLKNYRTSGRRSRGRTLKILPDVRDWNEATSGPTPCWWWWWEAISHELPCSEKCCKVAARTVIIVLFIIWPMLSFYTYRHSLSNAFQLNSCSYRPFSASHKTHIMSKCDPGCWLFAALSHVYSHTGLPSDAKSRQVIKWRHDEISQLALTSRTPAEKCN